MGRMQALPRSSYRFDNFELDLVRRRLLRDGRTVTLNPKAFDMLRVLVEHNGTLVTKEDLFRLVWHEQIVEESNLTVNMSAIRRALGETAADPQYITTVSGSGYCFAAKLRSREDEALVIENRTVSRIVVEDESFLEDDDGSPGDPYSPTGLPAASVNTPRSKRLLPFVAAIMVVFLGIATALWYFLIGPAGSTVPFTKIQVKRLTSSGKVTNATLSPDGKLFAYSLDATDGHVTLLLEHVDGSGRVELRPPRAVSYVSLTFTPDGSRIYYGMTSDNSGDNGLYRIPAFGGAPEKIKDTYFGRIAFSPDGREFAFVKNDLEKQTSSLMIADAAWQTEREVTSRPRNVPFITSTLDWSPDGGRIAASAVSDEKALKQELFVTDIATGAVKQVTNANWDGVRAIAWLDNGRGLIVTAGNQDAGWDVKLWHISESDGHAEPLVADLNAYGVVARLSADKKSLLTVQAQYYSNIWVAPANDLAAAKQVTHDMLGGVNGWMGLDWLPDGRIVYTNRNKNETIWVMDATGENRRQIIPDGGRNYNVSSAADGTLIVFDSDRSGTDEIWLANSDGGGMRQLTSGGGNSQPHISPDGKWVLFQSGRSGVGSLWKVSTERGEPAAEFTKVSSGWGRISPDGQRVASSCQIDGRAQLCLFSTAGGDPIAQFDLPRRANLRLGARWVADGTAVTYRDWFNGIWRQDLKGGEPVRLEGLPHEKLFAYGWSADGKHFAFSRGLSIQDIVLITRDD